MNLIAVSLFRARRGAVKQRGDASSWHPHALLASRVSIAARRYHARYFRNRSTDLRPKDRLLADCCFLFANRIQLLLKEKIIIDF